MPKGDDIAARLVKFAAGVVALVSDTPRDAAGRHIATQLLRSATGSGANYEEARGAESVRDFVHKLRLADKEMREAGWTLSQRLGAVNRRSRTNSHVRRMSWWPF